MRVGLVCPYSLTVPGGVQGQVLGLARALRASGHQVRVLAPCDGPPPDAHVTPLGDSVPTAANGSMAPLAPDLPAQLRFIRAVRDEDFEVLHLHEPLAPGATMTACLLKPVPLVGTFHAAGVSAAYRYGRAVVRWMAERLDVRCAVSDGAEALARRYLEGVYERVFNGIEIAPFATAEPWPTEGATILFVGRHEERKGLMVLLRALPMLPRDLKVWVAGDGPETERLRREAAGDPRVEWLGQISDPEKQRRLRAADVYCAPSLRGESFGVVLLEAMAASTPIVASDLEGYRLVARPDRDALLVPPGDAAALAAALRRVLTDPDTAKALAASGDQRAAEFSMHRLAERYQALYRGVVADAASERGGPGARHGGGAGAPHGARGRTP